MKKKNLTRTLVIQKSVISNLEASSTKGGINTFNCEPSNNAQCTFVDECFSKGPGCSRWQVC